jgi:hypothetical protein
VSEAYRTSGARASRVLAQVFDQKDATVLGGLNHLARFLKQLGIDRKLADRFRQTKAEWSEWRFDRVLRVMLDACFAGIDRLYHFQDLETEPLLCAQHGVDRLPDLKTLYRDLRRFKDPALLGSLHDLSKEVVVDSLGLQDRVVLEIDSTVETLYGRQEGAEIGPNPHKPGRPSYHPLLARDRISDLIIHHMLRPGDSGTATDIIHFLHRTLDVVKRDGKKREILARLDSGFEIDAVMRLLERRGVGYVIKMRATWSVVSALYGLGPQAWRRVEFDGDGEIEVADLSIQREGWSQARRMVVLRKREMDLIQGHLFDPDGWSYSFFVTDRDWKPEEVARFYDKRADVERTICEIKNDLAIDHVPTSCFDANAADLALKILARNLLVLYRIVRRGGRLLLRLVEGSPLHLHLASARLRS